MEPAKYFVSAKWYGANRHGYANIQIDWAGPENTEMLQNFKENLRQQILSAEAGPVDVVVIFFKRLDK